MSAPINDDNTPRMSGLSDLWLQGALELRRLLLIGVLAYQKRPDLGHDYESAARCAVLADRAELLADGFDSWTREPPDEHARGRDVDAYIRLSEEAGPLIERLRLKGDH